MNLFLTVFRIMAEIIFEDDEIPEIDDKSIIWDEIAEEVKIESPIKEEIKILNNERDNLINALMNQLLEEIQYDNKQKKEFSSLFHKGHYLKIFTIIQSCEIIKDKERQEYLNKEECESDMVELKSGIEELEEMIGDWKRHYKVLKKKAKDEENNIPIRSGHHLCESKLAGDNCMAEAYNPRSNEWQRNNLCKKCAYLINKYRS